MQILLLGPLHHGPSNDSLMDLQYSFPPVSPPASCPRCIHRGLNIEDRLSALFNIQCNTSKKMQARGSIEMPLPLPQPNCQRTHKGPLTAINLAVKQLVGQISNLSFSRIKKIRQIENLFYTRCQIDRGRTSPAAFAAFGEARPLLICRAIFYFHPINFFLPPQAKL
jgi:hypothetical protein